MSVVVAISKHVVAKFVSMALGSGHPESLKILTLFGGDRLVCCDQFFGCSHDDTGLVALASVSSTGEQESGEPTLVGVYVLPEFRGQGLGLSVLSAAISQSPHPRLRVDILSHGMARLVASLPANLQKKLVVVEQGNALDILPTTFRSDEEMLETALALAQTLHPSAAPERHAAFANSVFSLTEGRSGGYGGPSVRELLATMSYPRMSWCQACGALIRGDGPIFGPLTDQHREMLAEGVTFNDDPADLL